MEEQKIVNNNIASNRVEEEEGGITIQEIIGMFVPRWKWFVLSLVVCLSAATFYLLKTPPTYTRSAQLLIKDQNKAKSSKIFDQMQDMGFLASKSNVYDELLTIQSPTLMSQVVLDLRLNDKYVAKKGLRSIDLYKNTPVFVNWETPTYDQNISFNIHVDYSNSKVVLSNFVTGNGVSEDKIPADLGAMVSTPAGNLTVVSSGVVNESWVIEDLTYSRVHLQTITDVYCGKFSAALSDKEASAIDLTVSDASATKAVDILNSLIDIYNQNWVADRNKMAEATSEFINVRLDVIKEELTGVDNSIASFKGDHLLPDVSPTTVEAVLGKMIKSGLITTVGAGRGTKYIKNWTL